MTTEEIEKVDKYIGELKASIVNIQHIARLLNLPEELDEDVDKMISILKCRVEEITHAESKKELKKLLKLKKILGDDSNGER